MQKIQRREFIAKGSAALTGLAAFLSDRHAYAFPSRPGEEVVKWLDQLPPNPVPEIIKNQLVWEDLDSWITPNDKFFSIAHFNRPVIDASTWKLEIGGLVKKPTALTLDDIRSRPHQEVTFTVECSGNTGLPFFNGGIGNAHWAGTPLAPILEEAGSSTAASRSFSGAPTKARSKKPMTSSSSRISRAACRSPKP